MRGGMTIGKLARQARVNPRTIRYYEELGLLPKPLRTESGYRLYAADGLERLCLIMRVKQLGLSLSAVKEIVEYAIDGCCDKTERRLLELVETKLGEIEERIQELEALRGNLIQYQLDLSHRLESSGQQEGRQECVPFLCTGSQEKPDGLGKQV